MKKIINGYTIEEISNTEMADYFERAFNSQSVEDIICNAESIETGNSYYQTFGNILQAYATATGDLSDASIEQLAKDFDKNKEKCYIPHDSINEIDGIQRYFADHIMPIIIEKHCAQMDLQQPLSLKDNIKIQESIYMQCKNNMFLTHSFNGALIDKVAQNGLDISKEKFQEEFKSLEKTGMSQPYKINKLCFCELSKATFGYAPKSPERLSMIFSNWKQKQKNSQTLHNYLIQSLNANVESTSNTDANIKKEALVAGKKMIDFYFSQDKSAIAFMKENCKVSEPPKTLSKRFKYPFLYFNLRLNSVLRNDEEMLKMLSETQAQLKENNFDKLELFIDTFNKKYPEKDTLKYFYKNCTTKTITEDCLNNFVRNGNADGYDIEGGKVPADKFALCKFNNPYDLYAKREQSNKKRNNFIKILKIIGQSNDEDVLIDNKNKQNVFIRIQDKDGQVERLIKGLNTNIDISRNKDDNSLRLKLPLVLQNDYKKLDYNNVAHNLKFSYMLDEIVKTADFCGASISKGDHNNFRASLGAPSHLQYQEYVITGKEMSSFAKTCENSGLKVKESPHKERWLLELPNDPSIEDVIKIRNSLKSQIENKHPVPRDYSQSLTQLANNTIKR